MPYPIYAPRINNNDDEITVLEIKFKEGDQLKAGDIVADVETDKSVLEVPADEDGYVLKVLCKPDELVAVGSIMLWVGATADEDVPELNIKSGAKAAESTSTKKPTAKAQSLLKKHNLDEQSVPKSGERLSVEDIESFLAGGKPQAKQSLPTASIEAILEVAPQADGVSEPLNAHDSGMMKSVSWHGNHAVAGYIETEYDSTAWDEYSAEFTTRGKYMFNPLVALMAKRLVSIAGEIPKINTTIYKGQKYSYSDVNLGFTIQMDDFLYLVSIKKADSMTDKEFVDALGQMQRKVMTKKLESADLSGATLGFSSMARWKVSRHIPILSPSTSLMIAHSATVGKTGIIGASYDHRVLNGNDVAQVLTKLTEPPLLD